jgi:hypothetical protein
MRTNIHKIFIQDINISVYPKDLRSGFLRIFNIYLPTYTVPHTRRRKYSRPMPQEPQISHPIIPYITGITCSMTWHNILIISLHDLYRRQWDMWKPPRTHIINTCNLLQFILHDSPLVNQHFCHKTAPQACNWREENVFFFQLCSVTKLNISNCTKNYLSLNSYEEKLMDITAVPAFYDDIKRYQGWYEKLLCQYVIRVVTSWRRITVRAK